MGSLADRSVAEALRESVAVFSPRRDTAHARRPPFPVMPAFVESPSARSHDAMALRAGGCVDAWLTEGRRTLAGAERRHAACVRELRELLQARGVPGDVVPLILAQGGWGRTLSLFDRAAKLRAWAEDRRTGIPVYYGVLDQRKRAALVRLYAASEQDAAAYALYATVSTDPAGTGRTPLGDARYVTQRRRARRMLGVESSDDEF